MTETVTFPHTFTRHNVTLTVAEVLPPTYASPETGYLVEDYPYSFNLRCRIRYWLEYKPGKGCRFGSQTENPKNRRWNAPKYSTYSRFGAAMYRDEKGHVHHYGLSEYSDGVQASEFRAIFGTGVPDAAKPGLDDWVASKVRYDELVAGGMDWRLAGRQVALEMAKAEIAAKAKA